MRKSKMNIRKIITYFFLAIWTIVNIFPLYWLFTFSLKDNNQIFSKNVLGLPTKWMWSNYTTALSRGNMGRYFLNSILVTGLTILITVLFSLMASYAMSRLVWRGRKLANNIFMLGLTIPIHAALLPVFIILRNLRMTDSYQALIIPYAAFSLAMAIMISNGFMKNVPYELEEAACIDGCNVYQIFFRVIIPLMKPALSTIAIFTFLQSWNELMFAVIFISDSAYRTLSVGIQSLSGTYTTDWGTVGAALVIATFPTLIVYCFISKQVQESLIIGAVKG